MRRLSLSVERPDLLAQWSPKNEITPDKVTCGSHIKAIWRCERGHEWAATIKNRVNGSKCPYCEHRAVLKGYNDLKSRFPKIAKEWSEKNLPKKPSEVSAFSNSKFWWRCSNGHEWQARVADRSEGHGCPYCAGHLVWPGYNDLLTLYPDIAAEWSEKNGKLSPNAVSPKSTRKAWWSCNTCGFEFHADIRARVKGVMCPSCRAMEIIKQRDIRLKERSIEKTTEQVMPQLAIIFYSGRLGYYPMTESDEFLGLTLTGYIPELSLAIDFCDSSKDISIAAMMLSSSILNARAWHAMSNG